ncbi:ubiquitin carboxyl-terminal hydrolase 28-like isoform X3 [Clavelina lepadiformis]|uniref:ubiquitin carboxyl-terminal hydrolase 28-like isoform X3 n=1 Tax=Clavelina lepadiformis TaxID=159417 RepID=UPI004043610B
MVSVERKKAEFINSDVITIRAGRTCPSSGKSLQQINEQNEDAELQKAIELSLQDVDGPSSSHMQSSSSKFPDDDLERVLAQSIAEIEGRHKRRRPEEFIHYDPADPHRLLRKDGDWPVGLQNVGNTCWFNVVVQSLFHLPYFRSLLLRLTSAIPNSSISNETQRNLQFVHELRCLFAIMVASRRSYVDPIKCVNILQEAFLAKSNDSQQDASECIHMLLDQLEDVFRYQCEIQMKNERHSSSCSNDPGLSFLSTANDNEVFTEVLSSPKPPVNPMVELFYGISKTVGINNGNSFEQEHSFGILPLCIKGRKNLHESLEYTTARGHYDPALTSQEVWFTKLPPVLTFQLSRFHFNQSTGRAEKIHDRLSFPSILYMDRYLDCNMQVTREKREKVRGLRSQLRKHKVNLSRLQNFPNDGNVFELTSVLSCCADYACERNNSILEDAGSSGLKTGRRRLGSGSPSDGLSPNKRIKDSSEQVETSLNEASNLLSKSPPPIEDDGKDLSLACSLENEAQLVESVLRRWKREVEKQMSDLKSQILEAERYIDRIYEESQLHNHPYSLHAVLVHQGQATAGHYWAYIRDHINQRWLKFNDITVTEATFEQLNSDSVGNSLFSDYTNNSSAYCLIYVDSKRSDLFRGKDASGEVSLDATLVKHVQKHNQKFEEDLDRWNLEQATKLSLQCQGDGSGDMSTKMDTSEENGTWNLGDLKTAIDRAGDTYQGMGAEKALEKLSEDQENAESNSGKESNRDMNESEKNFDNDVILEQNPPDVTFTLFDEEEGASCPVIQSCVLAIMKVGKTYNLDGPEEALLEAINDEMKRLRRLSEEPNSLKSDPRLLNIVIYLYQNDAPRKVIERCILEQFTDARLKYDKRSSDIMNCALDKLNNLTPEDLDASQYKEWKDRYQSFCSATCHLIHGLELFHRREYFEALQHFVTIHDRKQVISSTEPHMDIDIKLVGRYSRICIQRVHEDALSLMRSNEKATATRGLEIMRKRLIPCMSVLLSSSKGGGTSHDLQLADSIRDAWCSLIEEEIVTPRDQLSDALTEFLDTNPMFVQSIAVQDDEKPTDLFQRYENVMNLLLLQPPAC